MDWKVAAALIAAAVSLVIGLSQLAMEREATKRIERLANARDKVTSGSEEQHWLDAIIKRLVFKLWVREAEPQTDLDRILLAEHKGVRAGRVVGQIAMLVSLIATVATVVITLTK